MRYVLGITWVFAFSAGFAATGEPQNVHPRAVELERVVAAQKQLALTEQKFKKTGDAFSVSVDEIELHDAVSAFEGRNDPESSIEFLELADVAALQRCSSAQLDSLKLIAQAALADANKKALLIAGTEATKSASKAQLLEQRNAAFEAAAHFETLLAKLTTRAPNAEPDRTISSLREPVAFRRH